MTNKKNMKKGITLIEIILAIVLIAIILGITIPKLMANSARAEIKAVISSDVKSIVEAATLWRKSNTTAAGSYATISAQKLFTRLPSTMDVDTTQQLIMSSGLRTGSAVAGETTGARYVVSWSFTPPVIGTTPTGNFSIAMDIVKGKSDLKWDAKVQAYATEVFNDVVNSVSDGGTSYGAAFTTNNGYDTAGAVVGATAFSLDCVPANNNAMCLEQISVSQ